MSLSTSYARPRRRRRDTAVTVVIPHRTLAEVAAEAHERLRETDAASDLFDLTARR